MNKSYNVDEFAQGVDISKLHDELIASNVPVSHVNISGDVVDIFFTQNVGSIILNTVDSVISLHDSSPEQTFKFHTAVSIIQNVVDINETTAWQDVGGCYANPAFFTENVNYVVSSITGSYKHDGSTSEIRMIEVLDDGLERVVTGPFVHDNVVSDWRSFSMVSNVPPSGEPCTYILQARLNDSTSLSIRYCNVSLLEVVQ